jgi:hypothetical protein
MNKKTFWLFLSILSLTVFLTACDRVPLNTHDHTLPTVELKIKNASGQFQEAVDQNLYTSGETLTFSCVAVDLDGIKSVELTFSPHHATNCYIEKKLFDDGPFSITGIPSDLAAASTADSENKVPVKLPLIADFGPIACSVPGKGDGVPMNNEITVTCKGENWSGLKADASVVVGVNFLGHDN